MSWYNPNTWSPDGKAVFVNILIGVVITGLELLRQWQEERGDFDGDAKPSASITPRSPVYTQVRPSACLRSVWAVSSG